MYTYNYPIGGTMAEQERFFPVLEKDLKTGLEVVNAVGDAAKPQGAVDVFMALEVRPRVARMISRWLR
jgi:hypothetical protein